MHRKFIALILATALAITGLSAAPARADGDTARLLAGIAALALIGAAIRDKQRDHPQVSHNYIQPTRPLPPRPLPPQITRRDLPKQCLRSHTINGRPHNLVGAGCLKNNYAYNRSLPYACKRGYWDGSRNRSGYEPHCLRKRGYRFARR